MTIYTSEKALQVVTGWQKLRFVRVKGYVQELKIVIGILFNKK